MTASILVVDDDPIVRESVVEALSEISSEVRAAETAEAALALIDRFQPDVVLTDVRMPGMDGLELLRLLGARVPATDVVLMTAYDDMPTVVTAMREGALDFLPKPLDLHELRRVLARIEADRKTRERSARAAEDAAEEFQLDRLIGRDPGMMTVYKLVGRLAANRTPVLIRGETGSGKELIARAIHYNSLTATEPMVAVNCTALPATLLESELFGHKRGSFTGAHADRRGRFALAGRGTIFLDEIGDTTPEFQAKLLRVLEDGTYQPVGGEKMDHTEARVIAATHQDLEALVAQRQFRQDLYYRLRVVEVRVPPLRDRMRDLPALAHHLVRRAAQEMHRSEPIVSEEAVEALLAHDWPGNVRELQNTLVRSVVLATGGVIRAEHVAVTPPAERSGDLASLEEVERKHVARVLIATDGQKTRAAKILGISRPRLDRLIAKYGLADSA